ncbi:MAG: ATP-grasp domain-containing protein [Nitrososphaerota archaeon]
MYIDKNILILSGGREAVEGIIAAKRMGIKTIVCDGNKDAPGKFYADEFIVGNIYDPDEIVDVISKYSKRNTIDGVITIASDAVRSVTAVAEYLNLPRNKMETAIISTDKLKMKECFREHSILIPKFTAINNEIELIDKMKNFKNAVLKPVDSRGSRGVIRLNKSSDLKKWYEYSVKFSQSRRLILEEWLSGPQISTESLVIDGKTYLCGISDRNYSNLSKTFPFLVEDGGETPSKHYPEIKDKIQQVLDKTVKALGLKNGVLKGDIVLKNNIPYIIEVATRLSGGFFSTITIPLVYHINLVEKAILLALGMKIDPPSQLLKHYCYEAQRFFFPQPGIVKKISKPNHKKIPEYVKYFELNVRVGESIGTIENHPMRKGSVLVSGTSRKQAIERANRLIKQVKIVTR